MPVGEEQFMVFMMFAICFACVHAIVFFHEKHPRDFNLFIGIILLALTYYVCSKKYQEACARLEQPQQTQEVEP